MKRILIISGLGVLLITLIALRPKDRIKLDRTQFVSNVLLELGDKPIEHQVNWAIDGVSAETGEEIVKNGFSKVGKKSKRVSKHFVCTSCHNIEQEDPDLRFTDPQARLLYTNLKGLPFLQGSALYGIVNRTKFYNQDYYKKYGNLVYPARNNIREAIQLCATECSQGRALKEWELESILAYLWTIGLKLEDLELENEDIDYLEGALNSEVDKTKAIELIKSKYLHYSPAHFVDPPKDRKAGTGWDGNPNNGKLIYDQSCKHCHYRKRYSFFNLDDEKSSFKMLNKHMTKYTKRSMYQVTRYGTSPNNLKKAYMPHFTKEKMSDQQLADLRAYVEKMAE